MNLVEPPPKIEPSNCVSGLLATAGGSIVAGFAEASLDLGRKDNNPVNNAIWFALTAFAILGTIHLLVVVAEYHFSGDDSFHQSSSRVSRVRGLFSGTPTNTNRGDSSASSHASVAPANSGGRN